MTLTKLLLIVAAISLVITALIKWLSNRINSLPVSYLQNFAGVLFIISGWVKAIDPMGTAFKLEQYFAEFESTFGGTGLSFIAPMFPWLSDNYAVEFAVGMIVFELVLGLMLIIGAAPRFTAWAFLLLVVFFTFLTGFTYLTGYVPQGVNFFDFGQWGPYVETNMKVTDCGCFGDFIKLKPFVSFLKDVGLLLPGVLFVVYANRMHQLGTVSLRSGLMAAGTLASLIYCFSNYVWDLPHIDFRPFKIGVNVAERKAAETEAASSAQVIAYRMTHKKDKRVVELPMADYLKVYAQYPETEWELEQIREQPSVPTTKISDFEVFDDAGSDVTESILSDEGYHFVIVAYKLYSTESSVAAVELDSVFVNDTLITGQGIAVMPRLVEVKEKEVMKKVYSWDEAYLEKWKARLLPILEQAQKAGHKVTILTAFTDKEKLASLEEALGLDVNVYMGDDIMLKTIIRSNPGLLLMRKGLIVHKWHYRQLPGWSEMQSQYIR